MQTRLATTAILLSWSVCVGLPTVREAYSTPLRIPGFPRIPVSPVSRRLLGGLRSVSANAGKKTKKSKSGRFREMKPQSKSSIMKRFKTTYTPCVILVDGTNMRGKFGFTWGAAGLSGLVEKWARRHSMQGKVIVVHDGKDGGEAFVQMKNGVPSIRTSKDMSADELIQDAIEYFHDNEINTVVCTNDKKLMKNCVAVTGTGTRTKNHFVTNNDFAEVLRMPVDYVTLRGKTKEQRTEDVIEAVDQFIKRFPEGNLVASNSFEHEDLFVSQENDKVYPTPHPVTADT
ncbi:hypothetical protein AAMO2058_001228600 [Amorphochlora amoebiformis]